MFAATLLAFREGLEAALILGIALSALVRLKRDDQTRSIWLGAGAAGLISLGLGAGIYSLGIGFEGASEQIFEGVTMLLAAAVLTWMVFWMQQYGRNQKADLEREVRRAAMAGGAWALFSLAFLAVLREGIELALFLTAAAFTATAQQTLIGGFLGLAAASGAGWLIFATTARLDIGAFFRVTSVLLILFAAGLLAHGVHEFNEVGWIPAVVEHVWNLNPLLHEDSGIGQILTALVGYNGDPSLTEVLAYAGYWVAVLIGLWRVRVRTRRNASLLQQA
jgi:high-affinity iron transporter